MQYMDIDGFSKIALLVLGSGGLWTVIQFFIQRYDNKKGMQKQIDKIYDRMDERDAIQARTHILRFNDELENGMKHSKDYFRQQIQDIDTYEEYCRTHPDFANGLTVMASKYIKSEYERQYQTHLGKEETSK